MTISELNTDNTSDNYDGMTVQYVYVQLHRNYMVPKCGHKICCDWLFSNIKQNKTTGNLCPLCRQESIPKMQSQ